MNNMTTILSANRQYERMTMKKKINNGLYFKKLTYIIAIILLFYIPAKAFSMQNTDTQSANFQYKKGLGAINGKYYYTAVQHFQKAIIIRHDFSNAWAHMGVALYKLGYPSLGIVCLETALKYNHKIIWAANLLKKYKLSKKR
ncbi:MAG: hypothetical protein EVJ46_03295 [Candidatus Acididesulfobacter guangdongensis]|uniref:Tetratricopeptide repeat protein n=1 Tax=Acididesulfobacter guangdongensis TaxID=2597225 RepID=A0A519BJ24_ACIG2|nr:MAG: hypothetical protein EVJ46_03295 [Candidatus Acididesulfobacter guangdongensis]